MAKVRLRLCEADRERFPRGDEWFEFDMLALFQSTPIGVQEEIEDAVFVHAYSLAEFNYYMGRTTAKALRMRLWIARYLAGVRVTLPNGKQIPEPFASFDPNVMMVEIETDKDEDPEDDASPPEEAPEAPGQTSE